MKLNLDHSLYGRLARRADGRVLVIDDFRSWSCGAWIGDLTVEWSRVPADDDFIEVGPLDGVAVYVHRGLVRLLEAAGPTVTRSHLPLFGGLRISLDRPELWIDYLDRPQAWAAGRATGPDVPASTDRHLSAPLRAAEPITYLPE